MQHRLAADQFDLRVTFGNRHRKVPNPKKIGPNKLIANSHEWTAFVRLDRTKVATSDLIEKVRFELHPSFGADYKDAKACDNFEFTCRGFGTFNMPITIFFKRETGIPHPRKVTVDHMLSFDGTGSWKTISVPILKTYAKQIGLI